MILSPSTNAPAERAAAATARRVARFHQIQFVVLLGLAVLLLAAIAVVVLRRLRESAEPADEDAPSD